jgi:acetylornithine deacetylase/succinyl-diaminopimelate desuccinylase-like protein
MDSRGAALDRLEREMDRSLDELATLARIPSVSAPGFEPAELARSAEATAALLRSAGLERVEVLGLPGAHPYVVAEWLGAGASAPTAVVYAHHDVQPPGRESFWRTPPFEPTRVGAGAEARLYGRGVVDDKAGILLHVAALRAWLGATGRLPLNVKVVIEGEEEIGSGHLAEFLRVHRERLRADVVVLSDTSNLETGLPSLTTSLRGLVAVDVRVRALDHPLHSGMWGGPVPDAATALSRLLARLVDDRGRLQIPRLLDDVPELDAEERARLDALPFDAERFRSESGIVGCAPLCGEADRSVYERLWWRPSLAVTALEGMPLASAANQLMAEASARVGVRLAPGQDAARVRDLVVAFLREATPFGVEVETRVHTATPGWATRAHGPAFDAARRALRAGYDRSPVTIGCGGSIPFVGPFVEVLGGAPALLLGLEDPPCNAHGENESLHLEDFRRAARASVHLWAELAALRREDLRPASSSV